MSVLDPRNRLVNFRLSETEFEGLRAACVAMGARSISDFARSAVLERMGRHQPGGGDSNNNRVFQLDNKVTELESRVGQLLSLVAATGTSTTPETVESRVAVTTNTSA
jgi:ABC-type hemin transport system substrate-binding protein